MARTPCLWALVSLLQFPSGVSFLASNAARRVVSVPPNPTDYIDCWRQQECSGQRSGQPRSMVVSSRQWTQDNYLQAHQSVKRRRATSRLLEITSILFGQMMRPTICSLIREHKSLLQLPPHEANWDKFWSKTTSGGNSNAERVAQGLPALGPTFVKLGQAMATRPDILNVPLAEALVHLQDQVSPFDNQMAKRIIRHDLRALMLQRKGLPLETFSPGIKNDADLDIFMKSLSKTPVAAASISQVYKGYLPGFGPVAVKVQRPGIRRKVEKDATLFHSLATWFEEYQRKSSRENSKDNSAKEEKFRFPHLPHLPHLPLVKTVDEFTRRVFEDMDFEREARSMELFSDLYSHRHGSCPSVQVVIPQLVPDMCSSRVIVMEWLEGTKLTKIGSAEAIDAQAETKENLALVSKAIECTISQFLDTGIVHADPHAGNLLKVQTSEGKSELGYLDFGLISTVPSKVRDAVVCAVVQLVFAHNLDAVGDLLVDLDMLVNREDKDKFMEALRKTLEEVVVWPRQADGSRRRGQSTSLPKVRFEKLMDALAEMLNQVEFSIPPYFLNNVRALATLEGIALKLDPEFNILRVIYPYSINHLMRSPSVSTKAQESFLEICRNPETRLVDPKRFMTLLNDWAFLTGYRKRRICWDLLTSTGGRHVSMRIAQDWYKKRCNWVRSRVFKMKSIFHQWLLFGRLSRGVLSWAYDVTLAIGRPTTRSLALPL